MREIGMHAGEICNRNQCKGIIKPIEKEQTINFCTCDDEDNKCDSCSEDYVYCEHCEWSEAEDYMPSFLDFEINKNNQLIDVVTSNDIIFHYPKF